MGDPLPDFVQQAFDRGSDPLEDAEICAWLEEHPQHLEAFAALRGRLRSLHGPGPRTGSSSRRPVWLFTIGAAAALLLSLTLWFRTEAPAVPRASVVAGAVRQVRSSTRTLGSGQSYQDLQQPGRSTVLRRQTYRRVGSPSAAVPRYSVQITTQEVARR